MKTIEVILNNAIADCFDFHVERSAPPLTPENVEFCEAQRKFMDSLSEEQREAYTKLENLLTAAELKEHEHYYRLGFRDALNWRVV